MISLAFIMFWLAVLALIAIVPEAATKLFLAAVWLIMVGYIIVAVVRAITLAVARIIL